MKMIKKDMELVKKLTWLMLIRLILITIVLAFGVLVAFEARPFYFIIGAFYIATIVYILLLKSRLDLRVQGYIQLTVELALITFIVHLTGGVESIFVGFYVITILCASVLLPVGGGVIIALLACFFFSGLVLVEGTGLLPIVSSTIINPYVDPTYVFFLLFYRVAILLLAGFLSSDIARRLTEAGRELNKLRDLNELILRHITSGLLTTNSSGQVIHANQAAEVVLRRTGKELLGENWISLFSLGESGPEEMRKLVSMAKSPLRAEILVPVGDGKKKPLGISISDILDEDGSVIGNVVVFRDLTEIKELESRIRRADRLSAVGELAAGIAHEIRNPLASIRGSIEVLKERGIFQSQDEKLVEVILKESDRLNQIIQNFLNYVRSQPSNFKPVDIDSLVDEIVMLIKHSDRVGDRIRIKKERSEEQLIVLGDGDQIKQVLFNIMDNAIEAMPDGGDLSVNCQANGDEIEIEITDTGNGIRIDNTRLFEPFYTTKPRGIGIGLAIAEKIAKNHGGRIDVRSRGEEGTIFTIVLPRALSSKA